MSLLNPIFEYFEKIDKWASIRFAQFTFLVLICNSKQKSFEDDHIFSVSQAVMGDAPIIKPEEV